MTKLTNLKKHLSIKKLSENIFFTLKRFPLTILTCILTSITTIWLIEDNFSKTEVKDNITKLAIIGILGIFLFTATKISLENGKFSTPKKIFFFLLSISFLVFFYFYLPENFAIFSIYTNKIYALVFLSILLFLLAPFLQKEKQGFWQYNRIMLENFSFAFISGTTLFIGVALSLLSIDFLFSVEISNDFYPKLWLFFASTVTPIIYLSTFPRNWNEAKKTEFPPKIIKIFSYYILFPLLTFYLIILYLYGTKIIITQNWPHGNVALMILSYATIGICTMMMTYPFRKGNPMVKVISKAFYISLIPLIFLMLTGLYHRVAPYGWTPARLLIAILALWLLFLSLYFILSKKYDLRAIYLSLMFFILISIFAPINIFTISANDQFSRLKKILEKEQILANGKVLLKKETEINSGVYETIESQIEIIIETGNEEMIYNLSDDIERVKNLDEKGNYYNKYNKTNSILRSLKISRDFKEEAYFTEDESGNKINRRFFALDHHSKYNLNGKSFDYLVFPFIQKTKGNSCWQTELETNLYLLAYDDKKIYLQKRTSNELETLAEGDLSEKMNYLWDKDNDNLTGNDMTFEISSEEYNFTCIFDYFKIKQDANSDKKIDHISAIILIKETEN